MKGIEMAGHRQPHEVSEFGEVIGPEVISALRLADLARLRTRLNQRRSLLRAGDEEAAAFELFLRGVEIPGPCGGTPVVKAEAPA